jgi:DNA-binding NarL/FixJ family response regulator
MAKRKVLIIDDDAAVTQHLFWTLCDEFEVMTANNLSSAVRRATIYEPDVTILDLYLPPTRDAPDTGLRILAYVKSYLPNSKVFVVCAQDDEELRKRCLAAGADLLITKPLDVTLLLEAVRKSLPWRL